MDGNGRFVIQDIFDIWEDKFLSCKRLFVGFSGGLDSVVLLYLLSQHPLFSKKLTAIHVNHGISPHALEWEMHCHLICETYGIPFHSERIHAISQKEASLEATLRKARYEMFAKYVKEEDALLLAHHQNDQAETVLLHLMRGAGVRGLGAIKSISHRYGMKIFRPFLSISRDILSHFAEEKKLPFIEDESNSDISFSRNFLRHRVLPVLMERWPKASEMISHAAFHCQSASRLFSDLAEIDGLAKKEPLALSHLEHLSRDRQINLLREWIRSYAKPLPSKEQLNHLISDVIMAKEDKTPELVLSTYRIRRFRGNVYLLENNKIDKTPKVWVNFPAPLPIGDGILKAIPSSSGFVLPEGKTLTIRFREGGEVFYWHQQKKSLKKLFQAWKIPPWKRSFLPLLYINEEIAAIPGHATSDHFYQKSCRSYEFQFLGL